VQDIIVDKRLDGGRLLQFALKLKVLDSVVISVKTLLVG